MKNLREDVQIEQIDDQFQVTMTRVDLLTADELLNQHKGLQKTIEAEEKALKEDLPKIKETTDKRHEAEVRDITHELEVNKKTIDIFAPFATKAYDIVKKDERRSKPQEKKASIVSEEDVKGKFDAKTEKPVPQDNPPSEQLDKAETSPEVK